MSVLTSVFHEVQRLFTAFIPSRRGPSQLIQPDRNLKSCLCSYFCALLAIHYAWCPIFFWGTLPLDLAIGAVIDYCHPLHPDMKWTMVVFLSLCKCVSVLVLLKKTAVGLRDVAWLMCSGLIWWRSLRVRLTKGAFHNANKKITRFHWSKKYFQLLLLERRQCALFFDVRLLL